MDKKLRIGIIGCGGIANGKHMPNLAKLKNVEMVAFCDIVKERAEEVRAALVAAGYEILKTEYRGEWTAFMSRRNN